MRLVRIWFEKTGKAKYISHLDLTRCITRAVRRAEIPLWYTEGFNPHPYITFARPLSLGIESLCETMDIKIESDINDSDILEKLSSVMPSGINLYKVAEPKMGAEEIEFARYEIKMGFEEGQAAEFFNRAREILSGDELIIEKSSKKGSSKIMKMINLIDYLESHIIGLKDNFVILDVVLPASNNFNINPNLLTTALADEIELEPLYTNVVRKSLLTKDNITFC